MKKILEYQRVHGELLSLEREINKNEHKKNVQAMISYVKDAQNRIINLDLEAKNLIDELSRLKAVQEKGVSLVERYTKQFSDKLSAEELKDLENKLWQANGQLNELENRLVTAGEKIKRVLQEFDSTKKKAGVARQRHQESKTAYDAYYKEKEPQVLEYKKQLDKMSRDLDPTLFAKYKALRQDGIFPPIVPLIDKRCGGCRMELPSNALEKLKTNGRLECESCRRLIYINE